MQLFLIKTASFVCFLADVHCRCPRHSRQYCTKNSHSQLLCKSKRWVVCDCLGYCVQYGKKSHWFTSSSAKYKTVLENNILSLCACQAFCWNGGYTKVLCTLYSPIDVMGSKLSHYGSLEEQHILTKIGYLSRKINIVINSTVSVLEDQLKLDSLCTSCNAVAQCLLNIDLITL